jgi:hypothetical protein
MVSRRSTGPAARCSANAVTAGQASLRDSPDHTEAAKYSVALARHNCDASSARTWRRCA